MSLVTVPVSQAVPTPVVNPPVIVLRKKARESVTALVPILIEPQTEDGIPITKSFTLEIDFTNIFLREINMTFLYTSL